MLAIITILCITALIMTVLCFYEGTSDYEQDRDEIFQEGYKAGFRKGYIEGYRVYLLHIEHEEITKGEGTE